MKVRELIEILQKVDPDKNVYLEYDTFCCVYENFVILESLVGNKYEEPGVYLCCERADGIEYHMKKDLGGIDKNKLLYAKKYNYENHEYENYQINPNWEETKW